MRMLLAGLALVAAASLGAQPVAAKDNRGSLSSPTTAAAQRNKDAAIAYWKTLNKDGWDAAQTYLSPKFREMSGSSPSGVAELKTYYNGLKKQKPEYYSLIVRAFAEGNLVFLHVRDVPEPGHFGIAKMVYFVFEDGKIVEQWTAKQDVPGIRNFNGMF